MQLLSSGVFAQARKILNDVHETLSRDVFIYKKAEQVYVTEDSGFIFGYPESQETSGFIVTSGTFRGRVWYPDKNIGQPFNSPGLDIKDEVHRGLVRLRLDASGADFIKFAPKITIDNDEYQEVTDFRKHGFFDTAWTDFWLKKTS